MAHYIALIHKDAGTGFGVSFPDVPGTVTVGTTIDQAMAEAVEVLRFAAEDWQLLTGRAFPNPRTIDELRDDPEFLEAAADAIVAAVPFKSTVDAAA